MSLRCFSLMVLISSLTLWEEQTIINRQYPIKTNQTFLEIVADNGLEQIVDFPTRKDNTLDLMLLSVLCLCFLWCFLVEVVFWPLLTLLHVDLLGGLCVLYHSDAPIMTSSPKPTKAKPTHKKQVRILNINFQSLFLRCFLICWTLL
jgi:hypothetical protein